MNQIPPIPVPKEATKETRMEVYFQWCEKMQSANPSCMLPLGVKKQWFHLFKVEHPFTTKNKRP